MYFLNIKKTMIFLLKRVHKLGLLFWTMLPILIISCTANNQKLSYNYYKLITDDDSIRQQYIIEKVFDEDSCRLVLWNLCSCDTINFKCKIHLKIASNTLFRIGPKKNYEPFFIMDSKTICKTTSFFLPIESTSKYIGEIDTVYGGERIKLYKFEFHEDVIDGQDLTLFCDSNYTFIKVIGQNFTAEKVDSLPMCFNTILKQIEENN